MQIKVTEDEAYSIVGALILISRLEKDKELSVGIKSIADKISKQHLQFMKVSQAVHNANQEEDL